MRSLLRSYFYRLFHSAGFFAQMGVLFVLGLIVSIIMLGAGGYEGMNKADVAMLAWTGSGLLNGIPWIPLTLFAFAGAIAYHREVSSGALRNYIVSGHSRKQIFLGLYLGNMAHFYILQVAGFIGLGLIGLFCAQNPGDGFNAGSFALCFVLVSFADFALFTFFYALYSVMKGHGFAGPLGVIIYVGLSTLSSIVPLVFSLLVSKESISVDAVKTYLQASVWIYPVLRDTLASGEIKTLPSAVLVTVFGGTIGEIPDNSVMNITAGVVLPTLLGGISFFVALLKFNKSDFK